MTTSPSTENQPLGQRMLAAIMFTDVVGFSRRVGDDEERTLRLVQRDLTLIGEISRHHDGRVLKELGDGCLVLFTSGVRAVECAQEIQRQFADPGRSLPPDEALQHRIGIHLGDVYLSDNEVLGDGVNVAARLQAEAPPGGICITQALYEIVKGRLALRTLHLGVRQLKNIQAGVHVYQVVTEDGPEGRRGCSGLRRLWHALTQTRGRRLALGAVVAVAAMLVLSSAARHRRQQAVAKALDQTATAPAGNGLKTWRRPRPTNTTTPTAAYQQLKAQRLQTRDYQGIVTWMRETGQDRPGAPLHQDYLKYTRLADLFHWLGTELANYTRDRPLTLENPRLGPLRIWTEPEGQLLSETANGKRTPVSLRAVPQPVFIVALVSAVARDRWQAHPPPDREQATKVIEGLRLFVEDNGLRDELMLGMLRKLQRPTGSEAGPGVDAAKP